MIQSKQDGYVKLSLPKFEIAYKNSLKDELTALGMGVAFSDSANFSRINTSGKSELKIFDVMHKTYCRVDEKGTEAAAVTSVEMGLTSMPVNEIQISFDRPVCVRHYRQCFGHTAVPGAIGNAREMTGQTDCDRTGRTLPARFVLFINSYAKFLIIDAYVSHDQNRT